MSLTVKINQFHLGKPKTNLIARVEFRGKLLRSISLHSLLPEGAAQSFVIHRQSPTNLNQNNSNSQCSLKNGIN